MVASSPHCWGKAGGKQWRKQRWCKMGHFSSVRGRMGIPYLRGECPTPGTDQHPPDRNSPMLLTAAH